MQVLSVGDLVFSSDPRVSVGSLARRWQEVAGCSDLDCQDWEGGQGRSGVVSMPGND